MLLLCGVNWVCRALFEQNGSSLLGHTIEGGQVSFWQPVPIHNVVDPSTESIEGIDRLSFRLGQVPEGSEKRA
jgi:hypothetical protein